MVSLQHCSAVFQVPTTNRPSGSHRGFPSYLACNRDESWINIVFTLTVRSGLSLSRWLTARMTPDLHGHRLMSPISGGSSPLTQRNRFPTSSGRASTAMALYWSKKNLEKLRQRRPYRSVIYYMKSALKSYQIKKTKKSKYVWLKSAKRPGGFKYLAVSTR